MTTWFGYFLGVACHVAFKWAGWKAKTRKPWMVYWGDFFALNLQAVIAAIVCSWLWEQGWLSMWINAAAETWLRSPPPPLRVTFWSSVAAGFILDSMGRTLLLG